MAGIFLFIVTVMFLGQRSLLYYPRPNPSAEIVAKITSGYEEIKVTTEDGLTLKGYFHAPADDKKPVVIAFHGTGSIAVGMPGIFPLLVKNGYGVLLPEYRGYGDNPGKPTEEGLYKDGDAFVAWVQSHDRWSKNPLVLYGHSLGTGVIIDLASRLPQGAVAALILETPFYSIIDASVRAYPFIPFQNYLVWDQYRSYEKITKVSAPKFFMLAEKDTLVGFDGGMKLYDLAQNPKTLKSYKDAGHNTVYLYGAAYDVYNFLKDGLEKQ